MPSTPTMNAADAVLSPERVAADPQAIAILSGDERVSYGELLSRVNRFGNGLAALGLERENRVLLMLKDCTTKLYESLQPYAAENYQRVKEYEVTEDWIYERYFRPLSARYSWI